MKSIKVKPEFSEPKIFDRAAKISLNAKKICLQAKDEGVKEAHESESAPENYASDRASEGIGASARMTLEQGRKFAHRVQKAIKTRQSNARQFKRYGDEVVRYAKASGNTVKATGRTVNTTVRAAKVTVKATKVSGYAARKSSIVTARAVKLSMRATIQGLKMAVKAVIATIKATITTLKGLVAAIAAGGWVVLVIVLIIAMIALLCASPFAIFVDGGENGTPKITELVTRLDNDLSSKISDIQTQYPDEDEVKIIYEGSENNTRINNWPDVLSVFSVLVNMDVENPLDVMTMDQVRVATLEDVFWKMNRINFRVEATEAKEMANSLPTSTSDKIYVLYINVGSLSYLDAMSIYTFTDKQKEILEELMLPKNQEIFTPFLESNVLPANS